MPTPATLYDIISTANACDYKVSSCGNTDEAPKRDLAMRGLVNPTTSKIQPVPSTETNSTLAISPSSASNADTIILKESKSVEYLIFLRKRN